MGIIIIDIFGEDTEEEEKKEAPKPEPKRERPRLRKQVINIEGNIVDLD